MTRRKHRSTSNKPRQARHGTAPGAPVRLYGRHAVVAALGNPERDCRRLSATPTALAELRRDLGEDLGRPGLAIVETERDEISRALSAGAVHQGLVLECAPLAGLSLEAACATTEDTALRVVVLDRVTDPQNVGAILRAAAAFNARAVIVPDRHAPHESGALAKAASGALDIVPLVRVTNLARALENLKTLGYWVVGLDRAEAAPIASYTPHRHVALVLGAEGPGLRRLTREACDVAVHLPISDAVESLNVAVAAAVALYALTIADGAPAGLPEADLGAIVRPDSGPA
jgi:23S rRNA (guanosine2251-2'-O)-methyltransferase